FRIAHQAAQHAVRLLLYQPPDFSIDGPPGTTRLHNGATAIQPYMPNLSLAWNGAVVNAAIDRESTANPTAERDIKDRIEPAARPVQRFAEGSRIGVVIHSHRHFGEFAQPIPQLKIGPALNLVRTSDLSRAPIDGPAKADAHPP